MSVISFLAFVFCPTLEIFELINFWCLNSVTNKDHFLCFLSEGAQCLSWSLNSLSFTVANTSHIRQD